MSMISKELEQMKGQKYIQFCSSPTKTPGGDTVLLIFYFSNIMIFQAVFARLREWFPRVACGNHSLTSSSESSTKQGRVKREISNKKTTNRNEETMDGVRHKNNRKKKKKQRNKDVKR